jgi:hypothetical protein
MIDAKWNVRHDVFNLIMLPIVCAVNLAYLTWGDAYYYPEYVVFLLYLIVDTLWLIVIPASVASPVTIIAHHLVCMVGWNIPIFSELRYCDWLSLGLLVEINTWFLIARRNTSQRSTFLQAMFYITWVALRMVLFPVVLVLFLGVYLAESAFMGTYTHAGLLVLCLMVLLNALNAKWTWDLFAKIAGADDHLLPQTSRGL